MKLPLVPVTHGKMTNHSEVDDAFTEKLIQGGGLKEKTLYRRKKAGQGRVGLQKRLFSRRG